MFKKELENLTMTPIMWSELNGKLSNDEYRKVVNDYQHREWLKLPLCKSLFGVCRYYFNGRCSCSDCCKSKSL